jgi:prophage regulatory protein
VIPRERLVRLPQVETMTGFKKSTLYQWMKAGTFPRPVHLGRMTAWPESSIHQWIQNQIKGATA